MLPAVGRSAQEWDERYATRRWLTEPSCSVVGAVADLPPGRAVDLACGTGRHARWLAAQGWDVVGVDFSTVGVELGRAAAGGEKVAWVVADVAVWAPDRPVDLVLAAYVQLGVEGFRRVAGWLSPNGRLVVVGHCLRNLTEGVHGPRDPELLHTRAALTAVARGLQVEQLQEVLRPDEGGVAIDLVLRAAQPPGPAQCSP